MNLSNLTLDLSPSAQLIIIVLLANTVLLLTIAMIVGAKLIVEKKVYAKAAENVEATKDLLLVATKVNEDTRAKTDKIERTVEKVAEKVEKAEGAGSKEVPKAQTPAWKPGDPDPRAADLGPQARGKGFRGWFLGPSMVLLGLMGNVAAVTVTADPPEEKFVAEPETEPCPPLASATRLMSSREYAGAADAFTRAAEAGSDREVCLARRAECLYYLGNYRGVLEEADRLERYATTSPWPAYLRGLVYKKTVGVNAAREQFHRALLLGHPQAAGQLRVTRAL